MFLFQRDIFRLQNILVKKNLSLSQAKQQFKPGSSSTLNGVGKTQPIDTLQMAILGKNYLIYNFYNLIQLKAKSNIFDNNLSDFDAMFMMQMLKVGLFFFL